MENKFGYKNMIEIPNRYDLTFSELNIIHDLRDPWRIIGTAYKLGFNRGIRYQKKKKKPQLILTATKQRID
nr:MAG TPA: hypothetical protein [Caudoviricetes sp.]